MTFRFFFLLSFFLAGVLFYFNVILVFKNKNVGSLSYCPDKFFGVRTG